MDGKEIMSGKDLLKCAWNALLEINRHNKNRKDALLEF
jgi:hypothetical protein